MTHNEYWQKRFEELKDSQMKRAELSKREIKKLFRQALKESEKEILAWYQRYAEENNLTLPQAKKELNARERKDFQLTLERYKELAQKQNLSPEYIKMLNNASMRVRLDRSQSLYLKLFYEIEKLANEYELNLKDLLAKTYEDSYYKTAYITQQVKGFEDVTALSSDRIEKTLSKPWTQDGKEFSTRIWEQKTQLVKSLQTEITQGLLTQRGTSFITERIAKKFNTSFSQAGRLVETETAYFQERSMLDCFNDLKVEKLQIIATLDIRTSEICREMDTKIVELKDAIPGVTTPPFHCYCRTTTIPYIEGITNADGTTRVARDKNTGKSYFVPADLTYKKWYDKYISNSDILSDGKDKIDVTLPNKDKLDNTNSITYKHFADGKDAKKYFTSCKSHKDWIKSLNDEELQAIGGYTQDDYAGINGYLRGGRRDAQYQEFYSAWKKQIRDIDKAIDRYVNEEPFKTYRFVDNDVLGIYKLDISDIENWAGKTITDKAYMSTTLNPATFENNADEFVMHIDVPKGKGIGAWVNELSSYENIEYEYLLRRNTTVKINHAKLDDKHVVHIYCEVI